MLAFLFKTWQRRYVSTILAILAAYFYLFISAYYESSRNITICIFKNLSGYPCPGCGITRGTIALFSGKFLQSFILNPMAIVINIMAITALVWMGIDFIIGKPSFEKASKFKLKPIWIIILVLLVFANWYWNFKKGY
ncbi:MAG: DUF2752 domain-containing protein [Bacteroidales bacterium]|mgnify:CR=1 FL=1|jgi:hypothetical protein|nr:DUF2752 domain-containing protein [Bacteroidales bacterium]